MKKFFDKNLRIYLKKMAVLLTQQICCNSGSKKVENPYTIFFQVSVSWIQHLWNANEKTLHIRSRWYFATGVQLAISRVKFPSSRVLSIFCVPRTRNYILYLESFTHATIPDITWDKEPIAPGVLTGSRLPCRSQ